MNLNGGIFSLTLSKYALDRRIFILSSFFAAFLDFSRKNVAVGIMIFHFVLHVNSILFLSCQNSKIHLYCY